MAGRGLRRFLQPVLYLGIALFLHGLLFLIPSPYGTGKKLYEGPKTVRGMKVRAMVPPPPPPPSASAPVPPPPVSSPAIPPPTGTLPLDAPVTPNRPPSPAPGPAGPPQAAREGAPAGPANLPPNVGASGPAGPLPSQGRKGDAPQADFGNYLSRLRSTGVQGWAKESAQKNRQGWRGSGQGGSGEGWGGGGKGGSGAAGGGGGGGTGSAGSGTGGRGGGRTAGDDGQYLDSRVRMLVIRYPIENGDLVNEKARNLEKYLTQVPYPNIKVKASRYSSGWQSVYIKVRTDGDGKIVSREVLRPEGNSPMEKTFLEQVQNALTRWEFDPGVAEIHVDVRFYVE